MADLEFFEEGTVLPQAPLPTATDPVPENGRYLLATSPTLQNQKVGMQAICTFSMGLPAFGSVPQTWRLYVVIQRNIQDTWVDVIGTDSGWAKESHGSTRILTVSPSTPGDVDGIEFWSPGSQNIRQLDKNGRVSYPLRAQVWLGETDPEGPGAFVSARVHCYGETFDA